MSLLLKRVACAPDAQPSKKAQPSQTLSRVTCAGDTASPEYGFAVTRDDVQTAPPSLLALFNLFILFILFFFFLFVCLFFFFFTFYLFLLDAKTHGQFDRRRPTTTTTTTTTTITTKSQKKVKTKLHSCAYLQYS